MSSEDPIQLLSDPLSGVLGLDSSKGRYVYGVVFFAVMSVLSYMIIVCSKPDFVYPGGKRAPGRKPSMSRSWLLSFIVALGLGGLYLVSKYVF